MSDCAGIDGLLEPLRLPDLFGIAGLVELHQRLQHPLDDLGHAQEFARGAGERECGHADHRLVERS